MIDTHDTERFDDQKMDEESSGAVSCMVVAFIPTRHVQAIDAGSSMHGEIEGYCSSCSDRRGAVRDRRECTLIIILSAVG